MAKEILKDEILKDEQLDNVAGGTSQESYRDMMFFNRYCGIGFDPNSWDNSVNKMGELYRMSGTKFEAHNDRADGTSKPNRYYDIATGAPMSYEQARDRLVHSINVWRAQGHQIG